MILSVGARLQGREQSLAALGRTCGMGIRRGTGILPVTIFGRAGCPLYSPPGEYWSSDGHETDEIIIPLEGEL
ncbi:MAG: hypothetical protein F6J90_17320 [Moorea sp. SIOASIH]|uniref:hypothetical protein n=1 Tax=Moorena sp. SIOASIH TaxID=2607817 RepID=UPI0013BAF00B|nr:hypothetical protein [Moorena sp. SIOASIH]NEO37992.1 hypothetical protein [Moorena sp. SIOASIH]